MSIGHSVLGRSAGTRSRETGGAGADAGEAGIDGPKAFGKFSYGPKLHDPEYELSTLGRVCTARLISARKDKFARLKACKHKLARFKHVKAKCANSGEVMQA